MTIAIVDVLKMIQIELITASGRPLRWQSLATAIACSNSAPRLSRRVKASCHACHSREACRTLMLRTMRRITSREQQHQGEEDPHQGQGDGDGAKVPADAFPQSVDPQQHAVKIAQFGPADIARQQTQPSWLSWTNARLSSPCSRGDSRVRTFPGVEEASRFKWLS